MGHLNADGRKNCAAFLRDGGNNSVSANPAIAY